MSESTDQFWENRIIEQGIARADEFIAHELNARIHPTKQLQAVRESLDLMGWIKPVIVSHRTNKLLDGHARIEEAQQKHPDQPVPFVRVDVTEEEEKTILLTLDPMSAMAAFDQEKLQSLLDEISIESEALDNLLTDLSVEQKLISPREVNPIEEVWQGMPDFHQENQNGISLVVHFEARADVEAFSRLVNQTITQKTRSIWFPYKEREDHIQNRIDVQA